MQIRAGTPLAYLMFWWPFLMSGITTLLFFSKLSLGKMFILFVVGILVGYGISFFLMMPISTALTSMLSQHIPKDRQGQTTFMIHYVGSFLLTVIVLWVLGRSLSSNA